MRARAGNQLLAQPFVVSIAMDIKQTDPSKQPIMNNMKGTCRIVPWTCLPGLYIRCHHRQHRQPCVLLDLRGADAKPEVEPRLTMRLE